MSAALFSTHHRCATAADCGSEACSGCELCQKRLQLGTGTPGGLRCEAWCTPSNCKKDACFGCKECAEIHPEQAKVTPHLLPIPAHTTRPLRDLSANPSPTVVVSCTCPAAHTVPAYGTCPQGDGVRLGAA